MDRTKFANDPESRPVLVLLRMAGKSQAECAEILHTTRQNISIEEQELRFSERRTEYAAILALEVLPADSPHRDLFTMPAPESDMQRVRKRLYV